MKTQERNHIIDLARGCGILLVMIGHCEFCTPELKKWFYAFHIPLFFFLSGMTFNDRPPFGSFLKKKIRSLVIPYFSLNILMWIWRSIIQNPHGFMNPRTAQQLLGMIVAWRRTPLYFDLWFVTCLFVSELVFYWVVKLRTLKSGEFLYWLVLLASSAVGYWFLNQYKNALPWAVDLVPTVLLFLGTGFRIKDIIALGSKEKKTRLLIALIFSLGISVLIASSNIKRVDLYYSVTGDYAAFLIGAYAGVAVVMAACLVIGHSRPLEFIGRNSLIFYAAQQYIFLKVTDRITTSLADCIPVLNHFLVKTGISVFLACCGLSICSVCINKCFPFILGRKRTDDSVHPGSSDRLKGTEY